MKPHPTRTFAQLPFQDLEPHRFEDLVRQLAYSHRSWSTLEAVGRSGDDGGVDIRGIEADGPGDAPWQEADADDLTGTGDSPALGRRRAETDGSVRVLPPRTWLFQVKREEKFGPSQAAKVAQAAVFDEAAPPFAFVLAVTANVSSRTRDALSQLLTERGVLRVIVWGRSELEDMLFDPSNDHLLFAYFGISLQVRSRNIASQLQHQLGKKRQVHRALGGLNNTDLVPVLLRDPTVEAYPYLACLEHYDPANPPWMVTTFTQHADPSGVELVYRRYPAWVSEDRTQFDVLQTCSHVTKDHRHRALKRRHDRNRPTDTDSRHDPWFDPHHDSDTCQRISQYHSKHVPEGHRAWFESIGFVRLEDILLVDDLGDSVHPKPHLLVTRDHAQGFFSHVVDQLTIVRSRDSLRAPEQPILAHELTRTALFPTPLPAMNVASLDRLTTRPSASGLPEVAPLDRSRSRLHPPPVPQGGVG